MRLSNESSTAAEEKISVMKTAIGKKSLGLTKKYDYPNVWMPLATIASHLDDISYVTEDKVNNLIHATKSDAKIETHHQVTTLLDTKIASTESMLKQEILNAKQNFQQAMLFLKSP